MPIILGLQRRARELGRIRMGQFVRPMNGKGRPEKLDRFRFTSYSEPLLRKVAALYGGTVAPWTPQGGGADGFEVIADVTRIPILVPPNPVSQYFELWSGGGCVRRCDGQTELLSGGQCVCGIDPEDRDCKPTTRLNVILRDVEGIGVWRLETHGWYAAAELPAVAEFLSHTGGYVPAYLGLEEKVVKRDRQTRRFVVPTLDPEETPARLLSGAVQAVQVEGRSEVPALPSGSSTALPATMTEPVRYSEDDDVDQPPLDADSVRDAIRAAQDLQTLRDMWPLIVEAKLTDLAKQRATAIERTTQQQAAQQTGDPDALWLAILQAVPPEWGTDQVEKDFENVTGADPAQAGAQEMSAYLTHLSSIKG